MNIVEEFELNNIACNLGAQGWHVDQGTAAIYEPATDEMIAWASNEVQFIFPSTLVSLLKNSNGCFYKKLTLFGIPPSLFSGGGLSRTHLQPQAITSANQAWRVNYLVPLEAVMVGSVQGWSENIGIFMLPSGECVKATSLGISPPFNLIGNICTLAENA